MHKQIEHQINNAQAHVIQLTQSILAKAFDSHTPVLGSAPQPAAAQNRSRRFCRGELTKQWRKVSALKSASLFPLHS